VTGSAHFQEGAQQFNVHVVLSINDIDRYGNKFSFADGLCASYKPMLVVPLNQPQAPGRPERHTMEHDNSTRRWMCCLLAACLLTGMTALRADPAEECRQEVQDYGIPQEQATDYLNGCILSRGGSLAPVATGQVIPVDGRADAAPPDDEPMNDAGQQDGRLPGGSDGAY
jgi:hypothetical protein